MTASPQVTAYEGDHLSSYASRRTPHTALTQPKNGEQVGIVTKGFHQQQTNLVGLTESSPHNSQDAFLMPTCIKLNKIGLRHSPRKYTRTKRRPKSKERSERYFCKVKFNICKDGNKEAARVIHIILICDKRKCPHIAKETKWQHQYHIHGHNNDITGRNQSAL